MSEPVRIVITMEGGLISAVCTLGVPVEALIIDYDTEGASPDEVETLDQGSGREADAVVRLEVAERLDPAIMASVDRFWPERPIAPGEFERAKLAGYTVTQSTWATTEHAGVGASWLAFTPDGDRFPDDYETEGAAWEACDRHRMFGSADQ